MSTIEVILSITTALFGGGNLIQFFQLKNVRRQGSAEAYQQEITSLKLIIDLNREEIMRLNTNYSELQEKYFVLAEELQQLKSKIH